MMPMTAMRVTLADCHILLMVVRIIESLTTQAQRPGTRDATIANRDAMPGSLQRMVERSRCAATVV